MATENKHIIYTAEDIKRYITGEMSPQEMHAIEMAALDDPLLAEAMEGYELMEQKEWGNELAALKQQLQKKEEETPVIPITKARSVKWWKAAAAVLILGATATTAYIFTNKNNTEAAKEIVKVQAIAAADSLSVAKVDPAKVNPGANNFSIVTTVDSNTQLIAKLDKKAETRSGFVTVAPSYTTTVTSDDAKTDSGFVYKPSGNADYYAMKDRKTTGEYQADSEPATAQGTITTVTSNNANAVNNNGIAANERMFKNKTEEKFLDMEKKNFGYQTQNNFNGLVVTPDNKPVSYASIKVPQSLKPIYTDANGAFNITAPDTSLKITVTSAGFNSQKYTLQNSNKQARIVLEPQVIATQNVGKARDIAAKKRQQVFADSTGMDDEEDAEPAGGWVEYNNYLSNNLKFPETAREGNIHGEVEITVKLKDNGDISQVKVDKPLSPDCDAEAIRLVKEGPKWDVKNTKKKKVKIKVKF